MIISSIRVSKGRTINTGNYNSVRYDYAVEADVGEDDDPEHVKQKLENMVDDWDEAEAKFWLDNIKKKS